MLSLSCVPPSSSVFHQMVYHADSELYIHACQPTTELLAFWEVLIQLAGSELDHELLILLAYDH